MADKLTRYDLEQGDSMAGGGGAMLIEAALGDWVKYEDAAKLEAENKRLHRIEEQRNEFEQLANAYRIKFETAEARLTAAREVLKAVEWVNFQGAKYCPKCAEWERVGHAPDCTLDAVLNKKEKV